jgi:hypothetical protein
VDLDFCKYRLCISGQSLKKAKKSTTGMLRERKSNNKKYSIKMTKDRKRLKDKRGTKEKSNK